MYTLTLKTRIQRVLLDGHIVLSIILGLVALLLSLGFLNNTAVNSNYYLLQKLTSFNIWALLFFSYSFTKLMGCLYRLNKYAKVYNSILGMWLWSYLVLSFVVFDTSLATPLELILVVPLVCEVWALTLIFYNPYRRRTTDIWQR